MESSSESLLDHPDISSILPLLPPSPLDPSDLDPPLNDTTLSLSIGAISAKSGNCINSTILRSDSDTSLNGLENSLSRGKKAQALIQGTGLDALYQTVDPATLFDLGGSTWSFPGLESWSSPPSSLSATSVKSPKSMLASARNRANQGLQGKSLVPATDVKYQPSHNLVGPSRPQTLPCTRSVSGESMVLSEGSFEDDFSDWWESLMSGPPSTTSTTASTPGTPPSLRPALPINALLPVTHEHCNCCHCTGRSKSSLRTPPRRNFKHNSHGSSRRSIAGAAKNGWSRSMMVGLNSNTAGFVDAPSQGSIAGSRGHRRTFDTMNAGNANASSTSTSSTSGPSNHDERPFPKRRMPENYDVAVAKRETLVRELVQPVKKSGLYGVPSKLVNGWFYATKEIEASTELKARKVSGKKIFLKGHPQLHIDYVRELVIHCRTGLPWQYKIISLGILTPEQREEFRLP